MNYSARICAQAQKIIESRNQEAQRALDARRREIAAKVPEISEIERQASSAAIKLSSLIIKNTGDFSENFERIKKNNLEAQNYIKRLLLSHGYPEDYLMIKYTCEECGDTGVTPDGRQCSCFRETASRLCAEELNRSANMPDCDFGHFDLSYYSHDMSPDGVVPFDKMREVLSFCRDYADKFSRSSESVLMIGRTGIGKTHLSLSIARNVIRAGYSCVYGSALNILFSLEEENFGRAPEGRNTMSVVTEADLLILDDLGAENYKQFYESALYTIINTRINLGIPTIISTNLDKDELRSRYNERIISRIFGVYTVVPFYGKDIRQIKRIGR